MFTGDEFRRLKLCQAESEERISEKWVKERAKCTLFKMFRALAKGVELDLNERNAQPEPRSGDFRLD